MVLKQLCLLKKNKIPCQHSTTVRRVFTTFLFFSKFKRPMGIITIIDFDVNFKCIAIARKCSLVGNFIWRIPWCSKFSKIISFWQSKVSTLACKLNSSSSFIVFVCGGCSTVMWKHWSPTTVCCYALPDVYNAIKRAKKENSTVKGCIL